MRAIIIIVALIFAITPSVGAELSDTMQRAAYCSGVLEYHIETFKPGENTPDNVCLGWAKQNYPSREACTADLEQSFLATMHQRLKRYLDYVSLQMAQRILLHSDKNSDGAVFSEVLIQEKGRDDAHAVKMGASAPNRQQCAMQCSGRERRCLVDCIAQEHPIAGNVMRCVMLPDELPY
jgi:hypothetical protein